MDKIIAEFKAKSLFIESLDRGLFFAWDLFDRAKKIGILIDAHALIDPDRNKAETIKLLYVCFVAYDQVSGQLNLSVPEALTIEQVSAWMTVCPDEATRAMQYATEQLVAMASQASQNSKKKELAGAS